MENTSGITYIIVDGYVDIQKYRFFYFIFMLIVYILVICSNSLIIYVISVRPSLHKPMYIFTAALCVNSLIYSSTIYPKLLVDFLSEKQVISYPACLLQWFIYYASAGSEFMILAAMAYDRYVSVCKPLHYSTIMTNTIASIIIAFAWLSAVSQTIAIVIVNAKKKLCDFVFRGIICNSTVNKLLCVSSKALTIYGLVALITLLILPVLFILYTYARIFFITKHSKEMRRKAAETCLPHLLVLINFTVFSAYDVLLLRIEAEVSKTVRFIVSLQMIIYNPLFNPLIYGLKMKEIHKNIKMLLSRSVKF